MFYVKKQPYIKILFSVKASFVLTALALATIGRAYAAPILPSGLSDGDTFQWAFVTSTTINARDTGNIADYNNHVDAAADSGSVTSGVFGDWKAIVTASIHARDNIDTPLAADTTFKGVYTLDGALIANNLEDLSDGSILAPINKDEDGNLLSTTVWTGSNTNLTAFKDCGLGNNCAQQFFQTSPIGNTSAIDGTWVFQGFADQRLLLSLYGISAVQSYSVPVPETAANALMIPLALLLIFRARFGKRLQPELRY